MYQQRMQSLEPITLPSFLLVRWCMRWFSLGMMLFLVGCTTQKTGDVADQSLSMSSVERTQPSGGKHRVQKGDTLYSIAFRYGWDWQTLAQRNNIQPPYVIRPGQMLSFAPTTKPPVATKPAIASATVRSKTTATTQPTVLAAVPITPASTTTKAASAAGWVWPAQGTVIAKFSTAGSLNKGIDIAGNAGQSVVAAKSGTVVYAGSGLRGYGELLIIKHDNLYVSAYGHNSSLSVREGQTVSAGQVIAKMGATGADRVKLHFEIRKKGKPVDPLLYLPK